jgi:hypothetical protein
MTNQTLRSPIDGLMPEVLAALFEETAAWARAGDEAWARIDEWERDERERQSP